MRLRYAPYLAAPIALAALIGLQWGVAAIRGPRPSVAFAFRGDSREARLLDAAARGGGVARLEAAPLDSAFTRPALVFWDQGFSSPAAALPAGGPLFPDLETLKDLAYSGSTVTLGYRAFAETENPEAAAGLAETAGIGGPEWIGAYLSRLDLGSGQVPSAIARAWEARNSRSWDFSGPGLLMRSLRDGEVLVLRRGAELGKAAVRARSRGGPGTLAADGFFSGWFCALAPRPGTEVLADIVVDLTDSGRALFAERGLASAFPALTERAYGGGRVLAMAGDFAGRSASSESIGPVPLPRLEGQRTLDSPENGIAQFQRILVPLTAAALEKAPRAARAAAAPASRPLELRAGRRYIERRSPSGTWEPWFAAGVDLGASLPGRWATEPPTDDGYYMETLSAIASAGFDSVRVYTLLPPAFYRALARFNSGGGGPLYLFQGIWLDEDPPGGDLLDPAWLAAELEETARCVDAVLGRASVAPRALKSWGEYRVDASPWLAAFMVGRELLPEEVEATSRAHPDYRWEGRRFEAAAGHPVESFLAMLAETVQLRIARRGGPSRPVGLVSWPTLDPLYHPGARAIAVEGEKQARPYDDSSTLDFRAITTKPDERAGFFAAFHIYPNFPDFLIRDGKYDVPGDRTGAARYGAYLGDLMSALPPVPLIVAEFGLATGYGTAHIHPEGLDHGGLSEDAQSRGLAALFEEIARRGAGGGFVFEWSDEWSKKAWTAEPYMVPYDRHALWHNVIDPEQNYGLLAWATSRPLEWADSGRGIRTASDEEYFYVEVGLPASASDAVLDIGLDTVPGEAGQSRLEEGGRLGPQGSEFKVSVRLEDGSPSWARLLVSADYDRDSGFLYPRASKGAQFTSISTLVNGGIVTEEGLAFPELREDGSALRVSGPRDEALVQAPGGRKVLIRLPWSRLNVSDPSSRAILLDPRDARRAGARDGIRTATIESIGVWAAARPAGGGEASYLPAADASFRAPLRSWSSVAVEPRPKKAVEGVSDLLRGWDPLALAGTAR
jgi:hypothetical protein